MTQNGNYGGFISAETFHRFVQGFCILLGIERYTGMNGRVWLNNMINQLFETK